MVTPTPTSISTIYSQYRAFGPTSTYYQGFLDPNDFPASYLEQYKSYYEPTFTRSCTIPSYYRTGLVTATGSAVSTATATTTRTATPAATGSFTDANGVQVQCDPVYKYYDSYYGFENTYVCSDGSYYESLPSAPEQNDPVCR